MPETLTRAWLAASCSVLAACAAIGEDFDLEAARQVENGMTQEQVIALMGAPPATEEGSGHGKLTWLYAIATPLSYHQKRVSFSLDAEGKVYGIPRDGSLSPAIEDNF